MGWALQPQVSQGFQHHGYQVDHVEQAEGGQQVVEEARELFPSQQKDRGGITWNIWYLKLKKYHIESYV